MYTCSPVEVSFRETFPRRQSVITSKTAQTRLQSLKSRLSSRHDGYTLCTQILSFKGIGIWADKIVPDSVHVMMWFNHKKNAWNNKQTIWLQLLCESRKSVQHTFQLVSTLFLVIVVTTKIRCCWFLRCSDTVPELCLHFRGEHFTEKMVL